MRKSYFAQRSAVRPHPTAPTGASPPRGSFKSHSLSKNAVLREGANVHHGCVARTSGSESSSSQVDQSHPDEKFSLKNNKTTKQRPHARTGANVCYKRQCLLQAPMFVTSASVCYRRQCLLQAPVLFTGANVCYKRQCSLLAPVLFTGRCLSAFSHKERHALNMIGLREHIERLHPFQPVARRQ